MYQNLVMYLLMQVQVKIYLDQIIINYRQQWLLENKKGSQQDDVFDLFDWNKEGFTKVDETENDDEIRMKFVPKEELQNRKKKRIRI